MKEFDEIIDKVMDLWQVQKEKAAESIKLQERADELDLEAEEIEKQMYDLLREAKEVDPESFEEFLNGFNPSKGIVS